MSHQPVSDSDAPSSPQISTYHDSPRESGSKSNINIKEVLHTDKTEDTSNLDLACIGNGAYSALIDKKGKVVWSCFPRIDGDPIFCALLKKSSNYSGDIGFFDVQHGSLTHSEQYYRENSAVLCTKLHGPDGVLEIIDFAPRFEAFEREYRPLMLVRILNPLKGRPRACVRLRPTFGYGWGTPEKTRGSNHIRYLLSNGTIRLTTNAPISYIVDEVLFEIDEPMYLVMMPDESLKQPLAEMAQSYLQKTLASWRTWVQTLSIPFEWQTEVIRACITLRMSAFEETGAIVAAMTTSIPYYPSGPRHDYRYCWLRDAMFSTHVLNQIGATSMMERYLRFISNFVSEFTSTSTVKVASERRIQSVYGISLETRLHPREMHRLPGYRGMGPVIIGTEDAETIQHDVYGSVILALTQLFFDKRLHTQGDHVLFEKLQVLGEEAVKVADKPDYGPRGRRQKFELHTYSVAMCWAACDRLAKISYKLRKVDRAKYWREQADKIHDTIMKNAWNGELQTLVSLFGSDVVDPYLLLLPHLGFVEHNDPKFTSTVKFIEKTLVKDGMYIVSTDDNDIVRNNATFWYINALAQQGEVEKARSLFENMLGRLNSTGIISESMNRHTGELWGNFPHNNAMVGLIDCAILLSKSWRELHVSRFSVNVDSKIGLNSASAPPIPQSDREGVADFIQRSNNV